MEMGTAWLSYGDRDPLKSQLHSGQRFGTRFSWGYRLWGKATNKKGSVRWSPLPSTILRAGWHKG